MTAKAATDDGKGGQKEQTFEKNMARLEKIVSEMESGTLSLEDMMARFEEGQELLKSCTKKLNEVEKRIEILVKKGGDLVAEPFDSGQSGGG